MPVHMEPNERLLRASLFTHLDGLVVLPTLAALQHRGLHLQLLDRGGADVDELAARCEGHAGYLNVALRLLASQGWLAMRVEGDRVGYDLLPEGEAIFRAGRFAEPIAALVPMVIGMHRVLEEDGAKEIARLFQEARARLARRGLPAVPHARLDRMLEGLLAGPLLTHLAMHGAKAKRDHLGRGRLAGIATPLRGGADILLGALGWVETQDLEAPSITEEAFFFAQRASAYGVTTSYLRTMDRLDELLFGRGDVLWNVPAGSPEIHVDRTMNVWGSGGAHAAYFKRMDELVVELFDRPIEEQPRGFADMGSGNGALIVHLFDLIYQHTRRGRMLREHPLFIVGADYNEAAQRATRESLSRADVWGEVMFGDVSDPGRLADDLRVRHGVDLGDLLNIRTFIDHNRMYRPPASLDPGRTSRSTGAFAFRGQRLRNADVEQDLCDHLRRWTPHLERFGLIVIELHTLPPDLAAAHPGRTAITAYDGTHGYSDQYIVEHDVFLAVAAEAGLHPVPGSGTVFPGTDLPVISVNWLKAAVA
ncbi:MAG: class I SAM-dependent methyltransferase [Flavobacteriales bacterium]|nr:class I SAM-dependent methyltransferase [Flavobacteriales bacterium]